MSRSLTTAVECAPLICEPGGHGLFLPLLEHQGEQEWPKELRAVLYLVGLLWLFMAVAIVSDIFMGAIERITSKKKRILNKETGRHITGKVWNDTVANLTLMALGSSAPEILLSVIELSLMPPKMMSGDLGPSTIVGSAAFNLFCITAVCVSSIPKGEVRFIKDTGVFSITATFSVGAYIWLLIIVQLNTPNVIEIWEGVVTLMGFPALVLLAFLADIGYFSESIRRLSHRQKVDVSVLTKDELASLEMKIIQQYSDKHLSHQQLLKLIEKDAPYQASRAHYRVGATRNLVGGKRLGLFGLSDARPSLSSVVPVVGSVLSGKISSCNKGTPAATVFVAFTSANYAVLESVGTLVVNVDRVGDQSKRACVDYATRNGTAIATEDYQPVSGSLYFDPGESQKSISITIIDDTAYEDDEEFFIDLTNPRSDDADFGCVALGENATARICIVDDDEPGTLSFDTEKGSDEFRVTEGKDVKVYTITVKRSSGSIGTITCKYATEDDTACQGMDFIALDDTLTFAPGQLTATIDLTVLPRGRYESVEVFRLNLTEPTGGAKFDSKRDGGAESQILTVIIESDAEAKDRIDKLMQALHVNYNKQQMGYSNWRDQFRSALLVNGGEESDEPPSMMDMVMHVITVFWKVAFAVIPPVDYGGGWFCFCSSLLAIGIITGFIGDLASLLGCVVGMRDSTTAITLVALGTSLPDTFASKTAAEQDPYADASIGNVTGSNSVNVFLGLGLPWVIGSLYWTVMGRTPEWQEEYGTKPQTAKYFDEWNQGGGKFIVVGDDLKFSVSVFAVCAVICIFVLVVRRRLFGGELGGPQGAKHATSAFLVVLWLIYVVSSIVYTSSSTQGCR